jgi:ParB-like chromosome segregation protein Spo0J
MSCPEEMDTMNYQLFPALDPATEAALRSSIERWGVLVPVAKDQHGNILDGHHRSRIADQLGVKYRVDIHVVSDADEAAEIARTLNTDRRHLDPAQRREMVAELRSQGHSTRAIAGAVGVDAKTVRNDLLGGDISPPDTVVGADGKRYPSTRPPRVEQAAELLGEAEPDRLDDVLVEAEAIAETADDIEVGVAEAVESRRTPMPVPKKRVADDVPPHPATFPRAVMEVFVELIPDDSIVLDPFAGVGTIHELHLVRGIITNGIELEPEWAAAHPRTICGDSQRAAELLPGIAVDVIATSPAYGNRLADSYNASDPHARRSYSIDIGRPLSADSGAGLHFDKDGRYETLHRNVWASVTSMLEPGGLFLLNCKDFKRAGKVMPVTGWHIRCLTDLGLRVVDLRCIPVAGLSHTTAEPLSELVVVLRKEA